MTSALLSHPNMSPLTVPYLMLSALEFSSRPKLQLQQMAPNRRSKVIELPSNIRALAPVFASVVLLARAVAVPIAQTRLEMHIILEAVVLLTCRRYNSIGHS